jgi:hypothetical protein
VYVPKDYHEKELQRALLQGVQAEEKKALVIEGTEKKAGRTAVI